MWFLPTCTRHLKFASPIWEHATNYSRICCTFRPTSFLLLFTCRPSVQFSSSLLHLTQRTPIWPSELHHSHHGAPLSYRRGITSRTGAAHRVHAARRRRPCGAAMRGSNSKPVELPRRTGQPETAHGRCLRAGPRGRLHHSDQSYGAWRRQLHCTMEAKLDWATLSEMCSFPLVSDSSGLILLFVLSCVRRIEFIFVI